MNSDDYPSPARDQNSLSPSPIPKEALRPEQNETNLITKLRQRLNTANKHRQDLHHGDISKVDLSYLSPQSQEQILRAVEIINNEDSINTITTLGESRTMLRDSFDEFKHEQDQYREQLEEIKRNKELAIQRRKENAIPLSIFLQQKYGIEGLADLDPSSGMNTTYQAYFRTLLTPDQNRQQHSTDKAAVAKYIRRRERRKRAEENKQTYELTDDILERQTAEIIGKMDGMDIKLENERQRQNDLLRQRMYEKKLEAQNKIETNEIMEQAREANLARQRVEQMHREKIEVRLLEARHRTPTNIIHVHSCLNGNDEDDGESIQLSDEQRLATKNSLQLLNDNDSYKSVHSITPVCVDEDSNKILADICI